MILSDKKELTDPVLEFLTEKHRDSKYLDSTDFRVKPKNKRTRTRQTTILLEQDVYDFLHVIAAQEQMSFNSVVHDILRNFIEKVQQ